MSEENDGQQLELPSGIYRVQTGSTEKGGVKGVIVCDFHDTEGILNLIADLPDLVDEVLGVSDQSDRIQNN